MIATLNLLPDERQLRQFGFVAFAAFGLLGGVVLWKGGLFGISFGAFAPRIAYVLWTLGILSAVLSLVWARGNRLLFVLLGVVAFPIGWLVSHVVLAVLFFGVLTPIGVLFRLLGRDPLERAFEREKPTYWVDLPEVTDKRDYFRQF